MLAVSPMGVNSHEQDDYRELKAAPVWQDGSPSMLPLSPLAITEPRVRTITDCTFQSKGDTVPPVDLWGEDMKASLLYRIASVLLLLFAAGHTFGFRQTDPAWGAGSVIDSMRSIHFNAQGFSRNYWDFFSAFGFFFSVFLLLAAILAWQLGGLPAETFARMRSTAWGLAISFAAVTALCLRYAFTTPIVFSTLVTICLIAAAWLSTRKPV